MSDGQKSRLSRATRTKSKLGIRENLIDSTKMIKIIKNMALKNFTNYREKGNRAVVRGR